MTPRIRYRPDTENQLAESLDIKHLRLKVKKQIDRTKTVLDKISGINIHTQLPVIIKKTLHRSK